MVGDLSLATRTEVIGAIRNRYAEASKGDKSRMLDEFVALMGCHRKHAVRLLNQHGQENRERSVPRASASTTRLSDRRWSCLGGFGVKGGR